MLEKVNKVIVRLLLSLAEELMFNFIVIVSVKEEQK
jgi:hypothetical protein